MGRLNASFHRRRAAEPTTLATKLATTAVAALSVVALAGCASPGPQRPSSVQPLSAGDVGLTGTLLSQASDTVEATWWRQFGSAELDGLVQAALTGNPSLAMARARFEQARAAATTVEAAAEPQVGLGLDASRQRYTAHGLYPPPLAGNVYNQGNVQVGLNWNPDFFSLHAAEDAATTGAMYAAEADAAAAASALSTQVTRVYIALARLGSQRNVIDQMVAERETLLRLTRARVDAGLDTQVDLTQSRTPLPELAQQRSALDEQITVLRHQLAALTAKPTDAWQHLAPTLAGLTLPGLPGQPGADLLGRRPDVAAARWRVEAATQDVQAARAQFYPNINLMAFVGFNAIGLGNVFKSSSRQVGIAPALRLPLFDAGLLKSRLKGREAAVDGAVAQYNAAVLDAVREATDALSTAQAIHQQRAQQDESLAHAQRQYTLAVQRRDAGLTGAQPALQARLQWLQQQRNALDLTARDLDNRALLFKALGGGWTAPTATALSQQDSQS